LELGKTTEKSESDLELLGHSTGEIAQVRLQLLNTFCVPHEA